MTLDDKIKRIFPEESVLKDPRKYRYFSGYGIPSFVKDWLIKNYSYDDTLDEHSLKKFLNENLANNNEHIKGTLVTEHKDITILARIIVEPDVKAGKLRFSIPDAGLKMNECTVPDYVAREHPELKGGEVWGIVTLSYLLPDGKDKGEILLEEFNPFKPYDVDLNYFSSKRNEFDSIEEWVDFLIRAMEYNPEGFDSFTQKLRFITRLLVFVESNLNMMELAPKGTGKSYVFSNLSKYGWIISGGTVTRAKLLYDIARESPGLIQQYQFLALDEIETIKFQDENELRGALKNYLESGSFTVAKYKGDSNCGLMVLGNIPLDENKKPLNKQYFADLHKFFKDSALLDRFHGFIEGWNLPRMREELKLKGYGLNVEYFSEILNEMRTVSDFEKVVGDLIYIPPEADTRDTKAIIKLATAYLKLLFPNVRNAEDIDKEDFKNYCLDPAMKMRGIIKYQISLIDAEFTDKLPDIKIK